MVIVEFLDVFLDANTAECVARIGQEGVERGRNAVGMEKLEDEAVAADAELESGDGMVVVGREVGKPLGVEADEKFGMETAAVNMVNAGDPLMDMSSFVGDGDLNEFAVKSDGVDVWRSVY